MPPLVALLIGVSGLAAYPVGVMLLRYRRRPREHECAFCGYSLADLAPDTACPECGRPQADERSPKIRPARSIAPSALVAGFSFALLAASIVFLHSAMGDNLVAPTITSALTIGAIALTSFWSSGRLRNGPAWLMTLPIVCCAAAFPCIWYDDLVLSHDDLTGISMCGAPVLAGPFAGWVFVVCAAIARWWSARLT